MHRGARGQWCENQTEPWEEPSWPNERVGEDPAGDETNACPDDAQADAGEYRICEATATNRMHEGHEAKFKKRLGEKLEENLRQHLKQDFKNDCKHALSIVAMRRTVGISRARQRVGCMPGLGAW